MVTFKNLSRFYSRNSRGKYQLDVTEIRSAFVLSAELPERIRRFRDDRLAKIVADETPIQLDYPARVVLHVLPIASFDAATKIDIHGLEKLIGELRPLNNSGSGWNNQYNFDGMFTYVRSSDKFQTFTYLQIFRNGVIEAVESFLLGNKTNTGSGIIVFENLEEEIIKSLGNYLNLLKKLNFLPPILVMLSLLNVRGYTEYVEPYWRSMGRPIPQIDRDSLIFPDLLIEDLNALPPTILRPTFDALWQACGRQRSFSYNEQGEWKPKR